METLLFLTPVEADGSLSNAAREAFAATIALREKCAGAKLVIGLWGGDPAPAARTIGGAGADEVLVVAGEEFGPSRYASDAAAAEAIVRRSGATIGIAPATPRVRRALPGVAARLDGRVDTGIVALDADGEGVVAQRWVYRRRIRTSFTRAARPWLIALDPGVVAPWSGPEADTSVETLEVSLGDAHRRTRTVSVEAASKDAQTIRPEAEMLFVAGAGWTKRQPDGMSHPDDAESLILGFLDRADASLGSSKSLVDQSGEGEAVLSFMSHLNQVGQTGSTPRHAKGLATCCHGEEPHVVGWRFVNDRRAVNLDANCGWAHGKADVLYIADAFEVMKKVNEKLGQSAGVPAGG